MKFSQTLAVHLTPEWQSQYINYVVSFDEEAEREREKASGYRFLAERKNRSLSHSSFSHAPNSVLSLIQHRVWRSWSSMGYVTLQSRMIGILPIRAWRFIVRNSPRAFSWPVTVNWRSWTPSSPRRKPNRCVTSMSFRMASNVWVWIRANIVNLWPKSSSKGIVEPCSLIATRRAWVNCICIWCFYRTIKSSITPVSVRFLRNMIK